MACLEMENGDIYFGGRFGVYIFRNNKISRFRMRFIPSTILKKTEDGLIWLASNTGIHTLNPQNNEIKAFTTDQNFESNIIQTIFFDDNLLWVGSYRKGLFNIRISAFENYPFQDFKDVPSSISEMNNGSLWISTDEGKVYELRQEGYKKVPIKTNLSGGRIKSIYTDSRNNIWICSYKGLLRISGNTETLYNEHNGLPDITIRGIVETNDGNYWISTRQTGLYKLDKNYRVTRNINSSNGLSSNFVMSIQGGKNGKVFVSTKQGIDILQNDSIIEHYSSSDGLAENMVYQIYEDHDGVIWIATAFGLSYIEGGKFFSYNKSRGLIADEIFDVAEDNFGFLWLQQLMAL